MLPGSPEEKALVVNLEARHAWARAEWWGSPQIHSCTYHRAVPKPHDRVMPPFDGPAGATQPILVCGSSSQVVVSFQRGGNHIYLTTATPNLQHQVLASNCSHALSDYVDTVCRVEGFDLGVLPVSFHSQRGAA